MTQHQRFIRKKHNDTRNNESKICYEGAIPSKDVVDGGNKRNDVKRFAQNCGKTFQYHEFPGQRPITNNNPFS